MLALAMLSLPCLGDACTYSVLTRCGTEYRAPQMACYEAVARRACLPWLTPALTGGARTRTRVPDEERCCAPVARRRLQVLARLVEARASAQHPAGEGETAMPFYDKGNVRIRYEEAGSGFPLLVTPGGGLNSRVSNWPTAVINAMEAFQHDFRCITMDQRNPNGGDRARAPAGPPWEAFAEDQLGVRDHLGIDQFFYMGYCIGGCFAGKLMQRAPDRVVAAVFCQSVGHRPERPPVQCR